MSRLQLRVCHFYFNRIFKNLSTDYLSQPSNHFLELNILKKEDWVPWLVMRPLLNTGTQAFNFLVSCRITWCNQISPSQDSTRNNPLDCGDVPEGVSQWFSFVCLSLCSELDEHKRGRGEKGGRKRATNKWKNNGTLISSLPQRGSCLAETQSCQAEPLNCLDGWSHLASISNSARKEEVPQRWCVGPAILNYYWKAGALFPPPELAENCMLQLVLYFLKRWCWLKGNHGETDDPWEISPAALTSKPGVPGSDATTGLSKALGGTWPYQVSVSSREGLSLVAKSSFFFFFLSSLGRLLRSLSKKQRIFL